MLRYFRTLARVTDAWAPSGQCARHYATSTVGSGNIDFFMRYSCIRMQTFGTFEFGCVRDDKNAAFTIYLQEAIEVLSKQAQTIRHAILRKSRKLSLIC